MLCTKLHNIIGLEIKNRVIAKSGVQHLGDAFFCVEVLCGIICGMLEMICERIYMCVCVCIY